LSKPTITICIDYDLMPVVKELQSRRKFSAFIQDSLRQHRSIIEAESLEHERDKVEQELQSLLAKRASIETKLNDIVVQEAQAQSIEDLVSELRSLNDRKKDFEWLGDIPANKKPAQFHDWHNRRMQVFNTLKDMGFDFSKLKE
jgi:flagellar motility protein MotE (MotC chaperone)